MTAALAPLSGAAGERPAYDTRHLAALDGMRGIAIALVMAYHFWLITWFPSEIHLFGTSFTLDVLTQAGMTGVTMFFFISGFALFYPYAQTIFDGRKLHSVSMFYYRRMLKILPSYYVGIALWLGLGFATYPAGDELLRQIGTHVFFLQTFWDASYGGINGVLWSLAVEVQFYLFFPLIAWAAMRRPLLVFGLMIVTANVYRLIVVHHSNAVHEIAQLPGTLDVFALGMASAWLFRALDVRRPALAKQKLLWTCVGFFGFVALYGSLANIYAHRNVPDWLWSWNVYGVPTVALSLVFASVGSLLAFGWWQSALGNPVLLLLSSLSYNLYLWHQLLANALAKTGVTSFLPSNPGPSAALRVLYLWIFIGMGLGVAWLLTTFLEQPLLRWRPFVSFFDGSRARARKNSEVTELATH